MEPKMGGEVEDREESLVQVLGEFVDGCRGIGLPVRFQVILRKLCVAKLKLGPMTYLKVL